MRFRRRAHSPASSISSAASSSSSDDTVGQPPLTPSTSDDEYIPTSLSVTAPNPKRLSVLFAKSMSDLRLPSPKIASIEELSEEDGEEAEWLTQEMQDFVTLSSPRSVSEENLSSRPESFLPPLRISNSFNGFSPVGPSAQLDPTFHFCQKKNRSFVIPSRPPPPPPIQICPASPLNNVFAVSSPCLSTTAIPPTPVSNRPPPRSSIPCDVDELMQMDADDFDLLEDELAEAHDSYSGSPFSSIFNAYRDSPSAIGFCVDDLPTTPSSFAFSDDSHHYDLPRSPLRRSISSISTSSSATRRLRSKWSTSTLGSVYNNQSPQSPSWMSKFSFKKGPNKEKAAPSVPIFPSPAKSAKKEKRRKFTGADIIVRHSYESDTTQVGRRDSSGSRTSSESAESSPSPGLRRKPIPVEIFMKQ